MRWLYITLCVVSTLYLVSYVDARRNRKSRRERCKRWSYGPCVIESGTCGEGVTKARGVGPRCRGLPVQHVPCLIPCEGSRSMEEVYPRRADPQLVRATSRSKKSRRKESRDRKRKRDRPQADSYNEEVTCSYKTYKWSDCDVATNTRTRFRTLTSGDSACKAQTTEKKPCDEKNKKKRCVYRKQQWTDCHPESGEMSRRLNLVAGEESQCQRTKVQKRSCSVSVPEESTIKKQRKIIPQDCTYRVANTSKCDPITNTQMKILRLQSGDNCKKTKTITEGCPSEEFLPSKNREIQDDPNAPTGSSLDLAKCRYDDTLWSACVNGRRTKTLSLRKDSAPNCPKIKTRSKACNKVCQYNRGFIQGCTSNGHSAIRLDPLDRENSHASCAPNRTVYTTGCRKVCRYLAGELSECDERTGYRTWTKRLAPGSFESCIPLKISRKSCYLRGSKVERCFYGSWKYASSCVEGKRYKTRQLLAGGKRCREAKPSKLKKQVDC